MHSRFKYNIGGQGSKSTSFCVDNLFKKMERTSKRGCNVGKSWKDCHKVNLFEIAYTLNISKERVGLYQAFGIRNCLFIVIYIRYILVQFIYYL